ncbi:MAG: hypothetical protein IJ666_03420 [Ruminococcus sp.]|nr:hypothetical protein [Ruminococcus sp.]
MSNALTHKEKSEETTSMIIGIAAIAVLTIICYIVGYLYSQSGSFVDKWSIHFIFAKHGFRYFSAALSMIAAIIMYIIEYKKIAGRSENEWSCVPNVGGAKYIYSGWLAFAVITAVVTAVVGFLIHCFAFQWQLALVKPLMIWVLIGQAVLTGVVFALPFCKPLKNA